MREIVDIQLARLQKRLLDRNLVLDVSMAAKDWLGQRGYDPVFGARPLKRVLQNEIETPLAQKIIGGEVQDGMHVAIDLAPGGTLTMTPVVQGEVVQGEVVSEPSKSKRRAG